MINLFPYQIEGAEFLSGRRRALLLDAPGLGKTAQGIRASDLIGADTLDAVCPASITTQWRHNHRDITTTECKFTSRSYEAARDKGLSDKGRVLILDELHYLKNPTAKRTQKILGRKFYGADSPLMNYEYVWGMTGTFSPKDPGDMYGPISAIIPGALLTKSDTLMTYWQYMSRFCVMQDNGFGMVVVGTKNLDELADRLAPYVLRRTKKDAMKDWKKPVVAELWLDPGVARAMLKKYDESSEGQKAKAALDKGGVDALNTLEPAIATVRKEVGSLKILPVVEWLLEEFGNGLDKVVLMCYHRDVISGIQMALSRNNVESVIYWGGMSHDQKNFMVSQFMNNPEVKVFIGQINTAGTGLDGLQTVTGRIVFVEFSYIDDENQQAIGRLDRIGQKEPVLAQFVGLEGSLDGAIMAAARKRAAHNEVLFG